MVYDTKIRREEFIDKLAKHCAEQVVGGWENSLADGIEEEMPSGAELVRQTVDMMHNIPSIIVGHRTIPVKKDIRFAGSKLIDSRAKHWVKECLKESY